MKDVIFISQAVVLLLNVVTFVYLLEQKVNYRAIRIIVLITFTIGIVATFGQTTWFSVIFSFTPALSLIKIKPHANIFHKLRAYFRRGKQSLQNMERSGKALHKQT